MYLFGSAGRGEADALSDVDVGFVLADRRPLEEDPVSLHENLRQAAARMLKVRRDAVDVTVLNVAPPLVAYQAIKEGRLLYCADEHRRVEFEDRVLQKALDLMVEMRLFFKESREAILEGSFYG